MKYCKKCGKIIQNGESNSKGLCYHCFTEYLREKLENYRNGNREWIKHDEKNPNSFWKWLKKIFKSKEK